ncbi:Uncharacterised protein [Mycobacterium tuberculosis]|nr:Uncharacterised protein [Mycobacterium tuberculosis]
MASLRSRLPSRKVRSLCTALRTSAPRYSSTIAARLKLSKPPQYTRHPATDSNAGVMKLIGTNAKAVP